MLSMFRLFARMIGEILDADEELSASRKAVAHEQELSRIQEQFIAILAHDLRNPVSSLKAGLRLMSRQSIDDTAHGLIDLMNGSLNRMGQLIDNLLDQARSRRGDDIIIERTVTHSLQPALEQIVAELQSIAPDQLIETNIDLPKPVDCDVPRVSQMFSNLLANAITHGAPDTPIQVNAMMTSEIFTLSVANGGAKIPDQMLPGLFLPFERRKDQPSREGLGLGLFIASEIAKGHGGTLQVSSDDEQTEFTFRMPVRQ